MWTANKHTWSNRVKKGIKNMWPSIFPGSDIAQCGYTQKKLNKITLFFDNKSNNSISSSLHRRLLHPKCQKSGLIKVKYISHKFKLCGHFIKSMKCFIFIYYVAVKCLKKRLKVDFWIGSRGFSIYFEADCGRSEIKIEIVRNIPSLVIQSFLMHKRASLVLVQPDIWFVRMFFPMQKSVGRWKSVVYASFCHLCRNHDAVIYPLALK